MRRANIFCVLAFELRLYIRLLLSEVRLSEAAFDTFPIHSIPSHLISQLRCSCD